MRSRLPVLRTRRRYLAFEVDSEEEIGQKELTMEIYSTQLSLFGDMGASQNRLRLISFDGKFGLLRCRHKHIDETRVILAAIYSINGIRAALRVKGVSGSI